MLRLYCYKYNTLLMGILQTEVDVTSTGSCFKKYYTAVFLSYSYDTCRRATALRAIAVMCPAN